MKRKHRRMDDPDSPSTASGLSEREFVSTMRSNTKYKIYINNPENERILTSFLEIVEKRPIKDIGFPGLGSLLLNEAEECPAVLRPLRDALIANSSVFDAIVNKDILFSDMYSRLKDISLDLGLILCTHLNARVIHSIETEPLKQEMAYCLHDIFYYMRIRIISELEKTILFSLLEAKLPDSIATLCVLVPEMFETTNVFTVDRVPRTPDDAPDELTCLSYSAMGYLFSSVKGELYSRRRTTSMAKFACYVFAHTNIDLASEVLTCLPMWRRRNTRDTDFHYNLDVTDDVVPIMIRNYNQRKVTIGHPKAVAALRNEMLLLKGACMVCFKVPLNGNRGHDTEVLPLVRSLEDQDPYLTRLMISFLTSIIDKANIPSYIRFSQSIWSTPSDNEALSFFKKQYVSDVAFQAFKYGQLKFFRAVYPLLKETGDMMRKFDLKYLDNSIWARHSKPYLSQIKLMENTEECIKYSHLYAEYGLSGVFFIPTEDSIIVESLKMVKPAIAKKCATLMLVTLMLENDTMTRFSNVFEESLIHAMYPDYPHCEIMKDIEECGIKIFTN